MGFVGHVSYGDTERFVVESLGGVEVGGSFDNGESDAFNLSVDEEFASDCLAQPEVGERGGQRVFCARPGTRNPIEDSFTEAIIVFPERGEVSAACSGSSHVDRFGLLGGVQTQENPSGFDAGFSRGALGVDIAHQGAGLPVVGELRHLVLAGEFRVEPLQVHA